MCIRDSSYANTAVRAELRINMRQIIRNRNGTRRTSLFTLFAANTAIPADFSGLRPFVMTGAADIDFAGCRNNIDQMIGTFPRAHTTAYALTLISVSYTHLAPKKTACFIQINRPSNKKVRCGFSAETSCVLSVMYGIQIALGRQQFRH